jgi:hypothetical protein
MNRSEYRWPAFWLLAFLAPVVWQLWIPPFTGLADNGDFAKVVGRFALKPVNPSVQDTFHFWIREWRVDESARWISSYWGTEVPLAWFALQIGGGPNFDMRWIGLVHVSIMALAYWQIGCVIERNWLVGLLSVFALSDAAYVTYFQSFYFDAAAIVFGFLFFAAWWRSTKEPTLFVSAIMALGGLGFALSKGPHLVAAAALGILLLLTRRKNWRLPAAALLAGSVWMQNQTKVDYKATAYYNLAFYKLGPRHAQALDWMEIRPQDRRLLGTHAFESTSPAQDGKWLREFYPDAGYSNVLRYYLAHPAHAISVMAEDLVVEAKQIRAENLGNYDRAAGLPYCTLSRKFSLWSGGKSTLFSVAPWHWLAVLALAAAAARRTSDIRLFIAGFVLLGAIEFALATLADALETYRHLLFFHVAYDWILIVSFWSLFGTTKTQDRADASIS